MTCLFHKWRPVKAFGRSFGSAEELLIGTGYQCATCGKRKYRADLGGGDFASAKDMQRVYDWVNQGQTPQERAPLYDVEWKKK